MSLQTWIKGTPMADVANLNSQMLWGIGSVALTTIDCLMLMSYQQWKQEGGLILAGMLLGAWTGKSFIGYQAHKITRETSREYIREDTQREAAKAGGPVIVTTERPAVQPDKVGNGQEWAEGDPRAGIL